MVPYGISKRKKRNSSWNAKDKCHLEFGELGNGGKGRRCLYREGTDTCRSSLSSEGKSPGTWLKGCRNAGFGREYGMLVLGAEGEGAECSLGRSWAIVFGDSLSEGGSGGSGPVGGARLGGNWVAGVYACDSRT
jgi:hypothetical protein